MEQKEIHITCAKNYPKMTGKHYKTLLDNYHKHLKETPGASKKLYGTAFPNISPLLHTTTHGSRIDKYNIAFVIKKVYVVGDHLEAVVVPIKNTFGEILFTNKNELSEDVFVPRVVSSILPRTLSTDDPDQLTRLVEISRFVTIDVMSKWRINGSGTCGFYYQQPVGSSELVRLENGGTAKRHRTHYYDQDE